MAQQPTALSDPQAYLALRKFNSKLPKCPRTGLPVSFSDIGDPNGIPLLWLMPSGCSRWFAAQQDPLCQWHHIRLIAIDRPGVGATPMVPLEDRIPKSCEMIVSVLEHLNIKNLKHILATSSGVYYAIHLVSNHSSIFSTGFTPPPYLYFMAPWSPLLPPGHPDYYPSYFTWIPTSVIATQHVTLPGLLRMGKAASLAWNTGTWLLKSSLSYAKALLETPTSYAVAEQDSSRELSTEIHVNAEIPTPQIAEEGERPNRLWGPCPCCISCLTTEYFNAENTVGMGQEHLQCLNRGTVDTGPEWFEANVSAMVAEIVSARNAAGNPAARLRLDIWWGWQDGMVPRQGQLWLNKVFAAFPQAIDLQMHDVPDGDHTDLLSRWEGIFQVYDLIATRGQSTAKNTYEGENLVV